MYAIRSYYGHRGGGKHRLKEEEGVLRGIRAVNEKVGNADQTAQVTPEHQSVADHPEKNDTDDGIDEILHRHVDRVITSYSIHYTKLYETLRLRGGRSHSGVRGRLPRDGGVCHSATQRSDS